MSQPERAPASPRDTRPGLELYLSILREAMAAGEPRTLSEVFADRLDAVLGAASERERALEEALADLFALVEDGSLVRNTTNDGHLPSFIAESARLVNALTAAKDLIAPAADRSAS